MKYQSRQFIGINLFLIVLSRGSSKWRMFGMVLRKQLSLLLNPVVNAEYTFCGCVSAIVDKMVSWLFQSFTKSFTVKIFRCSVLRITSPRCLFASVVIFTLELANKFCASINFFLLSDKISQVQGSNRIFAPIAVNLSQ